METVEQRSKGSLQESCIGVEKGAYNQVPTLQIRTTKSREGGGGEEEEEEKTIPAIVETIEFTDTGMFKV
jgi:hypothetical protein